MVLSRRILIAMLTVTLVISAVIPLVTSRAQGSAVTITLAVPQNNREVFTDKLLGEFEAATGIKVKIVNAGGGIPQASLGVDKHLDEMQKYVVAADVLYVDSNRLSTEATRAGLFLDLAPLVNDDKSLNVGDFYPALWQAFQWDKGVWALPTATDPLFLTYDAAAFDKAGLAYPNENWTVDDLDNAIRKLTQKDADGKVTQAGIDVFKGFTDVALFRSLIGEGLYDPNTIPNMPVLDKPAIEKMLDMWYKLDKEGMIGHDFNKAPLSVSQAFALILPGENNQRRTGLLLPGGKAALDTQGYAVSAGTQYPEQAYKLASWLTTRGEISGQFNATPARKSLVGKTSGNGGFRINIPADVQALIDKGLANGFSASELRYSSYLALALNKMQTEQLDAKAALQSAEAQAVKDQQAAADRKDKVKTALTVATPIPAFNPQNGKISLKFGLVVFANQLPFKDKWDKLIQDFAASDPQVGQIELNTTFAQPDKMVEQNDCFYYPFNAVPNVNPSLLLNLDPFLTADKSFDKADVLGNIMTQLSRDNKIWALPVGIEPSILKYDSQKFDKSGAAQPTKGWTIDNFKDAVKALKLDPKDPPPFEAPNTGGAHMLMLIAAYGALPLDYRTDPPMINFTDPATVDAIRQVLDLAKNGYLKYEALGSLTGARFFGNNQMTAPLYTDTLSLFSFRPNANDTPSAYKPTTYPKGSKFAALSYNIGTVYISGKSKNPEACYRWISTVAKHSELFSQMPARRSLLNDPALASAQGADLVALYNDVANLLQDPNTISIPSQFAGGASPIGFLLQHWLYEAFDKYVLNGGDLEAALKDAETISKGFQECAVNLPPLDASDMQKARDYIKAFGDCAVKVDPKLKTLFDLVK